MLRLGGRRVKRHNGDNRSKGVGYGNTINLNKFVELMLKFDLKAGKSLEVDRWMEEVEKTFVVLDILDGKKVDYVAYFLKGDANDQWINTKSL